MSGTTYQPQYRVHGTTTWSNFGSPVTSLAEVITGLNGNYDFQVVATLPNGTQVTSNIVGDSTKTAPVLTDGLNLTQAQLNTIAGDINATQTSEVPGGECFSGTCYPQDFLVGDIIVATAGSQQSTGVMGSLTDLDGNVWSLVAGTTFQGNPPDWWWGGVELNGSLTVGNPSGSLAGYYIAIRLLDNGQVYVEEAKQGGWWSLTQAQATNDWPWAPNPFGRPGIGPDPGPGPNNA